MSETEVIQAESGESLKTAVTRACGVLGRGEVVALPTETVYGLGANALDAKAVAKVFEAKQRPSFDPLIIHLAAKEDVVKYCELDDALYTVVQALIQEFWPGPLTLVLPKKEMIPDIVTSGQATVAVRMSAHHVMRAVCKEFGKPIAAPSANQFGKISPTSATAVMKELGGKIPLIVDGGACIEGLESTIISIDATPKRPMFTLLRSGPVVKEALQKFGKVVKPKPKRNEDGTTEEQAEQAPGMLSSHYAPSTPLYVFDNPDDFEPEEGKSYALLSYRGQEKDGYIGRYEWDVVETLSPGKGKLAEAAVRLFHVLRALDESGVDAIVAERVSETGLGVAINDRLKRASTPMI